MPKVDAGPPAGIRKRAPAQGAEANQRFPDRRHAV